jgi:hypothetical protein
MWGDPHAKEATGTQPTRKGHITIILWKRILVKWVFSVYETVVKSCYSGPHYLVIKLFYDPI